MPQSYQPIPYWFPHIQPSDHLLSLRITLFPSTTSPIILSGIRKKEEVNQKGIIIKIREKERGKEKEQGNKNRIS